jgi:hypothetical protein
MIAADETTCRAGTQLSTMVRRLVVMDFFILNINLVHVIFLPNVAASFF